MKGRRRSLARSGGVLLATARALGAAATVPALVGVVACVAEAQGQAVGLPTVTLGIRPATGPGEVALSLQILALLTVLTLAPALVVMLTSFTRIVVVLAFIRNALGTQQIPPNQVLIGLALFLTLFSMMPVWTSVSRDALTPFMQGKIDQRTALARAGAPIRKFMLRNTRPKDIDLFMSMEKAPRPKTPDDVPMHALIPAFVISELKTAFQMGFVVYVPFLVIDMVVASTLMSMGMMMLPPVMISLPFKILLFVLVDGWSMITRSLLVSIK